MTQPGGAEVGTAYVSLIPSARGFARKMRAELEREFKSANLDALVQQAFGNRPVTVPVRPDFEHVNAPDMHARLRVDVDEGALRQRLQAAVARADRGLDAHIGVDVDRSMFARLDGEFQKVIVQATQMGGAIGGALSSISGPAGTAALLIAGIGAAAVAGIPAVTALAGAIAAIPTAITGASAAFGALSLGFKGIADAFKPKAGGGGGGGGEDPASRARRIAGAERGVAAARRGVEAATRGVAAAERGLVDAERNLQRAQEASKRAQLAVNRAREEAAEDLEDLNRQLRGAQLDEQDAALGVEEALRRLNEAKETGNLPDIQRANLEYEQAKLNLENATDAADDLGKAQEEATKKGIDGSDKVQDALRDQRDASDAVRDAQNGIIDAQDALKSANDGLKSSYDGLASATDSLAEAQKKVSAGGGGGGIADVVKLAPEAQKFVNAIKRLAPAFDDLRLDVQNRLFRDLDDTVTNLGKAWIPALKKTLGSYADTFNGFFRTLGANISKPKFIDDLQAGAEGARKGLKAIGDAVSGPLVEAFGALSRAGAPFLQSLGEELGSIVEDFSNWILAARDSGELDRFFTRAREAMHDLFTTGRQVGRLVKNLFTVITGRQGSGKSALDSFNDALDSLNDWLEDPANQQKINDFITGLKQDLKDLINDFRGVKDALDTVFADDGSIDTSSLGDTIGRNLIAGIIAGMVAAVKANFTSLGQVAQSIVDHVKDFFGIHSPSTVFATIGGYLIDGLMKGIRDKFGALMDRARQLPGKIKAGIGATGRLLYAHGQNAVIGLINGIGSWLRSLSTRVGRLKTTITDRLSNAGNWLYNAGRNVVIGLWNGIASLGSWLGGKVSSFIDRYVPDVIQNQLGIHSPSRVAAELGKQVPAGLAVGIESGNGLVESAARSMADAALPNLQPTTVGAGVGASATSGAAVELYWRTGASGDRILDGLRDMIGARYRGDPVAALSRR